MTTQWRASPEGDRQKARAYAGRERIAVDPDFFRRLDARLTSLNEAGLLAAPVLLWAIGGGSDPSVNPGVSLPDDQAIKLARYMIARWQAHDVIWILPGDGDYRGDKAEKWKRIGRGVFGDGARAASARRRRARRWCCIRAACTGCCAEFKDEAWVDLHGYQSGHGDDDKTLAWMTEGPPSKDWKLEPAKPFINLEPPYEYHLAYQSKTPITPHTVRRAVYWSLLNAPVAGVTYGGHGVWGWDDGTKLPTDHTGTGMPLPWQKALVMPGAEQMAHVASLFTSIDYWRLRPAPQALAAQPGAGVAERPPLHRGRRVGDERSAGGLHPRRSPHPARAGGHPAGSVRHLVRPTHRRPHTRAPGEDRRIVRHVRNTRRGRLDPARRRREIVDGRGTTPLASRERLLEA